MLLLTVYSAAILDLPSKALPECVVPHFTAENTTFHNVPQLIAENIVFHIGIGELAHAWGVCATAGG